MEKFQRLLVFYNEMRALMSAICVTKGGIDMDNYSGRYFAADFLEFLVAFGEKAGIDVPAELKTELLAKKGLITPGAKPIYEMTLAEFEKMIGEQ